MSLSAGRAERAPQTVSRRPAIGTSPGRLEQRVYVVRERPMRVSSRAMVVIVACALNVAMVESQLLRHREAVRHSSVDQSLGEGVLGIPELFLTFDIVACQPVPWASKTIG